MIRKAPCRRTPEATNCARGPTRAVAKQLHAWARSPGQTIELLLQNGRRFSVVFRMGWEFYRITVRLTEV